VSDFTTAPRESERSAAVDETAPTDHGTDTSSNERLTTLDARLSALERAVTDGETDVHSLDDSATVDARLDDLAARTDEIETRLDELDAAVQSLRGYVGAVRAVNREVERRADAALSAVDRLDDADRCVEPELPDRETGTPTGVDGASDAPDDRTAADADPPDRGDDADTARREAFAARVRDLL
jgi:ABC-type transporter Mla subunit MlaD